MNLPENTSWSIFIPPDKDLSISGLFTNDELNHIVDSAVENNEQPVLKFGLFDDIYTLPSR